MSSLLGGSQQDLGFTSAQADLGWLLGEWDKLVF